MTQESDRERDLAFANELADLAARVTLAGFGGRIQTELKHDATPVTALDGAAEAAIRSAVEKRFPNDGFQGEEHGQSAGNNGRTWIVDPIDGTRMFAEGIPLWTTLIALQEGDRVVVAVADAPALGNRYHAVTGTGAYRDGNLISVSDVSTLSDAFVLHAPLEEFNKGIGVLALQAVI
ncbi:MAG TPA: inositol monophosphatase family protein, partial [Actinomycetes bacterium]|nr:inositol monophosphatase family protein [Actinomycetes bacterium]